MFKKICQYCQLKPYANLFRIGLAIGFFIGMIMAIIALQKA